MMSRFTYVLPIVLIVGMITAAPVARAQSTETDVMHLLRADIQANRQALVAANLELTEEEGESFWPLYRQYRQSMARAGDRLQKLILEHAKVHNSATPEQASAMLDEMLSIEVEELRTKQTYAKKFRKVMPVVQVARLFQIENKIDAIIRYDLAESIPLIRAGS
jgi:hypothetical protein